MKKTLTLKELGFEAFQCTANPVTFDTDKSYPLMQLKCKEDIAGSKVYVTFMLPEEVLSFAVGYYRKNGKIGISENHRPCSSTFIGNGENYSGRSMTQEEIDSAANEYIATHKPIFILNINTVNGSEAIARSTVQGYVDSYGNKYKNLYRLMKSVFEEAFGKGSTGCDANDEEADEEAEKA